jgi:hypothetical protein
MNLRDIEETALEQGFRVGRTMRGHPVFHPPDPRHPPVYGSGTPGDRRAIVNLLAALRRAGLVFPRPRKKRRWL